LGLVATPLTVLARPEILKIAVVYEDADRWMTQVIPSFENENTGVKVAYDIMPWEPLYARIMAIMDGRIIDCYDVVMMASTTPSGKTLDEWYKEISTYYAEDLTDHRKDFESAGIDFVEYKGRILGVRSPGPHAPQDWLLVISKNSKNRELAFELLMLAGRGGLPKHVKDYLNEAKILKEKGEIAATLNVLLEANKLYPKTSDVLLGTAKIYKENKTYDKAIDYLEQAKDAAKEKTPGDTTIHYEVVKLQKDIAEDTGDYDPVIDTYTEIIEITPGDATAHKELGDAFIETGNIVGALSEFIFAKELDRTILPESGAVKYNKDAIAQAEAGNYFEAEDLFNISLLHDPGNESTLTNYATMKANLAFDEWQVGNIAGMAEIANESIKIKPTSNGYYILGVANAILEDIEKAMYLFNDALSIDSQCYECENALGVIYARAENFDSAKTHFEKALKINSEYTTVKKNLGIVNQIFSGELTDVDLKTTFSFDITALVTCCIDGVCLKQNEQNCKAAGGRIVDAISCYPNPCVEAKAPQPRIVQPIDGSVVGGLITIEAIEANKRTADSVSVTRFEYCDGTDWMLIDTDDGRVVDSDQVRGNWFAHWDTVGMANGEYTIRVSMADAKCTTCVGEESVTVQVVQPPVPIANVLYCDKIGNVAFESSESYDPDGHIVSWEWDFGDNTTDSGENVNHTYVDVSETYIVSLTVVDKDNISDTEQYVFKPKSCKLSKKLVIEIKNISLNRKAISVVIDNLKLPIKGLPNDVKQFIKDATKEISQSVDHLKKEALNHLKKVPPDINKAKDEVNAAKENVKKAISKLDKAANKLPDGPNKNKIKKNIEKLKVIQVKLEALSAKLWLLKEIGLDNPHADISIPGVKNGPKTHYKQSGKICTQYIVIQESDINDPDVILHEIDHHFMFMKDKKKLPGGDHQIGEKSNKKLAWSEGWATFSSAAKRKSPTYKDVEPGDNDDMEQDLENDKIIEELKKSSKKFKEGEDVEGTISGILWDLFDGTASGTVDTDKDGVSIPFKCIWKAISKIDATHPAPKNITDFYKNLKKVLETDPKCKGKAAMAKVKKIFTDHGVVVP